MSFERNKAIISANSFSSTSWQDEKPVFVPPPEAMVFYPNEEEFQDPIAYIGKIRPLAEKTGICKIKPPSQWRPPFAADVDKFKFIPRVQKLNELDAKTRIKLNFLEKIAKFWELQGTILKIPLIEGRPLDLYTFYVAVHTHKGFVQVTNDKKWLIISKIIGYEARKNIGIKLKDHYKRLLYPFDLFNDQRNNCETIYNKTSRALKNGKSSDGFTDIKDFDPLENYVCHICKKGDAEDQMLLCDGCDDGYHIFCLIPPLSSIPEGDWCCPKCVAEACSKLMDAFGFEQAQKEYTLEQFGDMADKFKMEYFKKPTHEVSTSIVEQEFWKIISTFDEDVTVEYGADLHAMDHGSGFPTLSSKNLFPGDKEYAESPWNLNNLPVIEDSVLRYITADISGIKVPWMYVGMCFATFCWHCEDHWTYSINYLHWGEPKTWYAVPSNKAELFESTMKSAAPELFNSQPDLLHQLVTIINPNILMNSDVPVYRIDQNAGEFVITFPRAFHAGFNQGYNFAEAVNFATADWIKIGRESVLHYSNFKRFCVFSHDEIICTMASNPDRLTLKIAAACYQDMLVMVDIENKLRKNLHKWGIKKAERFIFEAIPDEDRLCEICKTTCFLSAVFCTCSKGICACLRHFRRICQCPPENKTFKYRHSLSELAVMLKGLKLKTESYDEWVAKVQLALEPKLFKTLYLDDLKALLIEANAKKFPKSDLFLHLMRAVKKAEKFASIIHQLNIYKRCSGNNTDKNSRITVDELKIFKKEIESLVCLLEETKSLEELLKNMEVFEKNSNFLLSEPLVTKQIMNLENCKQYGVGIGIEHPNLGRITSRIEQLRWLHKIENSKNVAHAMDVESIKNLIQEGSQVRYNAITERELSALKELLKRAEDWGKRATDIFNSNGNNTLVRAEQLFQEASTITCFLTTEVILYEAIESARDWLRLLREFNLTEHFPSFDAVEDLVQKGKKLALHLEEVDNLSEHLEVVRSWRQEAFKLFLDENSTRSLLEVLAPRTSKIQFIESFENITIDSSAIVTTIKEAAIAEFQMIKSLRNHNMTKSFDFFNYCFCVCAKGPYGIMIQCELCQDWFHSTCVNLQKQALCFSRNDLINGNLESNSTGWKFLCPRCKRTKRPDKKAVLRLLSPLRKFLIRVPEGEVLHFLAERALTCQHRAKNLLEELHKNSVWDGNNLFLPVNIALAAQIEEILVEGDLLEISLAECSTLWSILLAIHQPNKRPNIIDFTSNLTPSAEEPLFQIFGNEPKQESNSVAIPAFFNMGNVISDDGSLKEEVDNENEMAQNWISSDSGIEDDAAIMF